MSKPKKKIPTFESEVEANKRDVPYQSLIKVRLAEHLEQKTGQHHG
jgi:hypothetical protein